ncbi:CRISPR-associated protein, Csd2 family [Geoalkalibacter ferrihydriticus]|uniref:CRISPR-associated protein Csd2 n=2 Tax=Geoalkalibacter ferrihydriticus TaxID=392333 RepID=A0A0C2HU44_9BACT|nr:type I-C CRISPR-associated protein Cas7/Csd2 [Geoalkalibacter ferrihydriticus]KIH76347.1 CRISPR-associated protein Csd2 [Geoalkalibacter ferrihydriticus DSM 17813]SDL19406.1 CRISPR-associated protein, Csd2 family [Geoalkalibacter ferrihydriticus]
MTAITNRYEFVLLFDVENGNPNGDPDAGNMPRIDPETGHGLVTDVCLKRKIRNHVALAKEGAEGFNIYVQEKAVLNQTNELAYKAYELKPETKKLPKKLADAQKVTGWMCANFFDIRSFGAVMTTEVNCGQVRGPVQLAFAKSVEPIIPQEISITRMAVTNERDLEKERTMGRKHIVPYGLYVAQGFVSAPLAEKTGFSEDDLGLLWDALVNMFEHDRSAARGVMSSRKLYVFKHKDKLGNAPAHKLFDLVEIARAPGSQGPARSFKDFSVNVGTAPTGIEIIEKL